MQPRLLEREAVLAEAARALDAARAGRGGTLVLTGDAGCGKSSVLAAIAAIAEGFALARVCGEEMETGVPFAALERLLDSVDPGRSPEPAAIEPSVPYVRTLERLRQPGARPLLLIVDDLHWVDADTLGVLTFIARRLQDLPVLLAAALRPWPPAAADACAALASSGHARSVPLTPLSAAAGRDLLDACVGNAVSDETARRVRERCGGNPLLIAHAGAALTRSETLEDADQTSGADRLLRRCFAGLPADALGLARAASVLGTSFPSAVAAELADLTESGAIGALEALSRSGVVTTDGPDRLRFVHPLLRQVLYDDLAPASLRHRHAQAFAALLRRGRSADACEHAIRADLTGDATAIAVLERVGRAALQAGAIEVGTVRLEAAARFAGDGASPPLQLSLIEALCSIGRCADAAQRCRGLLRQSLDWQTRVQALMLLGRCAYLIGDPDHGNAELDQAVAIAERGEPAAAIAPLLEQIVSIWMAAGPAAALPVAQRVRDLAAASGVDPAVREEAEIAWAGVAVETGNPEATAATDRYARRLRSPGNAEAVRVADLVSPLSPLYGVAHCALFAERFDDADTAFTLAADRLDAAGAANGMATVSVFRTNLQLRRGDLHGALGLIERAARYSEFTPLATPFLAALRGLVLTWMGRSAGSPAAEQAAVASGDPWQIRVWIDLAAGLRGLWAGDARASHAFTEIQRTLSAVGVREPNHTQYASHAVAAHLLADRPDRARGVVDELAPLATRHPARWPRFALALSRARIDDHAGRSAEAAAGYERALDILGDAELPLHRADALLAQGSLIRRLGQRLAARPLLAEALRIAEHHAAMPLAAQARAELRLAGGRRRAGADRDLLTAAELRVARAAASGRSNAEIAAALHLSSHTVASHLRRVYSKLGIGGRGQLIGTDLREK